MNKKEAMNLLTKEDIIKIMNFIHDNNITVKYWDNELEDEQCKWFIHEVNIYDFLSYYMDLNLHWTKLWIPLTKKKKKNEWIYEVVK